MESFWKVPILLSVALGVAGADNANTGCTQLQGLTSQAALEYLQHDRDTLNGACVVYAMDQIATTRYAPSVNVLIRYLDYHVPPAPKSQAPLVQRTVPWLGTWYPAARGLVRIGKDAVPALIAAVADASTADLARKNAIEVILLIYREDLPEGAAILNRAGRAASNAEIRQRLLDAARELAAQCPEPQRGACMSNALK